MEYTINIPADVTAPERERSNANEDNLNAQTALMHSQAEMNMANVEVAKAQAKIQQLVPLINLMGEIRTALNFPMVADNQMTSEKVALEKMWEPLDIKRLQARYFATMDEYFKRAEIKLPS